MHLIRDGRDVAPSACALSGGGNAFVAADTWLHALEDWELIRSRIERDQWIEIRFEDLVTNTRETLEVICDFLGLSFDDGLFAYANTTSYSLPEGSAAERWRKKSREQVWLLERKIGSKLIEYGYPVSAPKPPGKLLQATLWLDNKIRAAMVRVHRYGLGLYLQRQIVKEIRFPGYRDKIIGRMTQVDILLRK